MVRLPLVVMLASILACTSGDPPPAPVGEPVPVAPPVAPPVVPLGSDPGPRGPVPTRAHIQGSWDVLEGPPGDEFVLTNRCDADPPNIRVSGGEIDVGYGQEDARYTIVGERTEGDTLVLDLRSASFGDSSTARLRWEDERRVLAWSGVVDWRTVDDATKWRRMKECCAFEAVEYDYATVGDDEPCPPAPAEEAAPEEAAPAPTEAPAAVPAPPAEPSPAAPAAQAE